MNCDKNFKKGLVVGSILGGALVAFGMSKKGKELRTKLMDYSEELSKELKKRAVELGVTTKEMYEDMVHRAVEEFAKQKELALDLKEKLVEQLKQKWDDIQTDLLWRKVKNKFKETQDKTREGFDKVVHDIVDEYESKKDLAGYMKYRLVRDLKKKWNEVAQSNEHTKDSSEEGWR
jgi:gas vesicle protein